MYGFEDYTRIKHVMQYHGFEGLTDTVTRARVPDPR